MYTKTIMDKFQNPKNAGALHGANAVGEVGGNNGNDLMKLYLIINNSRIENAKFKTFGCAVSIAVLDVFCDLIKGKNVEDAMKVSQADVIKILGEIPNHKRNCLVLGEECVKVAIQDYFIRQEKDAKRAMKKAR